MTINCKGEVITYTVSGISGSGHCNKCKDMGIICPIKSYNPNYPYSEPIKPFLPPAMLNTKPQHLNLLGLRQFNKGDTMIDKWTEAMNWWNHRQAIRDAAIRRLEAEMVEGQGIGSSDINHTVFHMYNDYCYYEVYCRDHNKPIDINEFLMTY